MATGIIRVTDDGDSSMNVELEFGEEGIQDESHAHRTIVKMLTLYQEWKANVEHGDD